MMSRALQQHDNLHQIALHQTADVNRHDSGVTTSWAERRSVDARHEGYTVDGARLQLSQVQDADDIVVGETRAGGRLTHPQSRGFDPANGFTHEDTWQTEELSELSPRGQRHGSPYPRYQHALKRLDTNKSQPHKQELSKSQKHRETPRQDTHQLVSEDTELSKHDSGLASVTTKTSRALVELGHSPEMLHRKRIEPARFYIDTEVHFTKPAKPPIPEGRAVEAHEHDERQAAWSQLPDNELPTAADKSALVSAWIHTNNVWDMKDFGRDNQWQADDASVHSRKKSKARVADLQQQQSLLALRRGVARRDELGTGVSQLTRTLEKHSCKRLLKLKKVRILRHPPHLDRRDDDMNRIAELRHRPPTDGWPQSREQAEKPEVLPQSRELPPHQIQSKPPADQWAVVFNSPRVQKHQMRKERYIILTKLKHDTPLSHSIGHTHAVADPLSRKPSPLHAPWGQTPPSPNRRVPKLQPVGKEKHPIALQNEIRAKTPVRRTSSNRDRRINPAHVTRPVAKHEPGAVQAPTKSPLPTPAPRPSRMQPT